MEEDNLQDPKQVWIPPKLKVYGTVEQLTLDNVKWFNADDGYILGIDGQSIGPMGGS